MRRVVPPIGVHEFSESLATAPPNWKGLRWESLNASHGLPRGEPIFNHRSADQRRGLVVYFIHDEQRAAVPNLFDDGGLDRECRTIVVANPYGSGDVGGPL